MFAEKTHLIWNNLYDNTYMYNLYDVSPILHISVPYFAHYLSPVLHNGVPYFAHRK